MAEIALVAMLGGSSALEGRVSASYALAVKIKNEDPPPGMLRRPPIPKTLPSGEEVVVLRPANRG